MSRLFIEKSVEIDASAGKVWKVLTMPEYTDKWTPGFSSDIRVESDWQLGSPVLWKSATGKVEVEGNVTKVIPEKILQFTVFDVDMGRMPVTDDDGILFELSEQESKTTLKLRHGDFAVLAEAEKYYSMTLESWEIILPKIKELAEAMP
ncbi:SRPBCC domain-containing protein [Candidatus Falkowbacteria bacterium]|nr:SRPBCC domain-containing protein [Candidatus Falkowbacteria bacterium]